MALVEDKDAIKALAADTADDPLDVRILPRGASCGNDFLDAHVLDLRAEEVSVNRVTIAKQEARRFVVRKRFNDLLSRPLGCRMRGDVEVGEMSSMMTKNHEGEQYAERRCRYCEEIDGNDIAGMIVEKGPPRLRRRLPMPDSILAHGCFGHGVPQQREFGLNARDAPAWILA